MKNYKKVDVNDNVYTLIYDNGEYEIYFRTCGPSGVDVFNFKNNSLKWHQRRSYGGSSKKTYYFVPFQEIINRKRH